MLSRDFRREQGHYEDVDNLFAMHLLYNLSRYSVRVNDETALLEIDKTKHPMSYTEAAALATQSAAVATQSAAVDSESFRRRQTFQAQGIEVGDPEDSRHVYEFADERSKQ